MKAYTQKLYIRNADIIMCGMEHKIKTDFLKNVSYWSNRVYL